MADSIWLPSSKCHGVPWCACKHELRFHRKSVIVFFGVCVALLSSKGVFVFSWKWHQKGAINRGWHHDLARYKLPDGWALWFSQLLQETFAQLYLDMTFLVFF